MRRLAVPAVPVFLVALACGGSPGEIGGPAPLEGIWCQTDTPYCYEFRGEVVNEDLGPERRESGTWEIQGDLLLLHYTNPDQTITWVIDKRTDDVLLLADHQSQETFIMNRMESMPPVGDRPK